MARPRNAPPSSAIHALNARQALREKTNTQRTGKAPGYSKDVDIETLVKDAKPKRGRLSRKTQYHSDELMMAGGLGETSEPPTTTDELAKSDDVPLPTARPNRRQPRTVKKASHNPAQSKILKDLKQRMDATARRQRAKQTSTYVAAEATGSAGPSSQSLPKKSPQPSQDAIERSEASRSPSPPPPGRLSVAKKNRSSLVLPGSVLRMQGTPAMETSILALKNFKRRPRQLSMLQMVQQRTASARPSMAHTAVETTAAEDPSSLDLDIEFSDEDDDFAPEAEGTPLHAPKATRLPTTLTKPSNSLASKHSESILQTGTRKRNSDHFGSSSASLGRLSTKRQKSQTTMEAQKDSDAGLATSLLSGRGETPQPPITSDVQVVNSPSTSTPPTEPPPYNDEIELKGTEFEVPSTEREHGDEEVDVYDSFAANGDIVNSTMAEPVSSSPVQTNAPNEPDDLAYPTTQPSPVLKKRKPERRVRPLTTATLQSLLPKRRQPLRPRQRKSEYDIDSDPDLEEDETPIDTSHLEADEDELADRPRRQTRPAASKTPAAKRGRPKKAPLTTGRKAAAAASARKSTLAPSATKPGRGLRTYGRATTSDKENDDAAAYESAGEDAEADESISFPDASLSFEEASRNRELEDARRKFAEVDDWDMEFESMSAEMHRSSSLDWR